MNLRQRVLITATIVAGIGVGAFGTSALAGSSRDCSKLKKWNYDKAYKKGEIVWYSRGGMNHGAEFKCDQDSCQKIEPTSSSDRNVWRNMGACDSEPK